MPSALFHCARCKTKTPSKAIKPGKWMSSKVCGIHSICARCGGKRHSLVGSGFFDNFFHGRIGDAFDDLGNGAAGMAHHAIEAGAKALPMMAMGIGKKRGGRGRGRGRAKGSVHTKKGGSIEDMLASYLS